MAASTSLTVALRPSAKLAPTVLDQLVSVATVVTLDTSPIAVFRAFQTCALRVAANYTLCQTAIPIHYQNLRDQLREQFGLDALSDRHLLELLKESSSVEETTPGVFRARGRVRAEWPRPAIKEWSQLLATRFGAIGSFEALIEAITLWNAVLPFRRVGRPPAPQSVAILEIGRGNSTALYDLQPSGVLELTAESGAFFESSLTSRVLDPLFSKLDADELAELRRMHEWRNSLGDIKPYSTEDRLVNAAKLWIDLTRTLQVRRQEQKWRGWYLVPEHGPLNIGKLRELQKMLIELTRLAIRGAAVVDTSPHGVANALSILRAGQVSYQHSFTARNKRDLFIRQQKNYLVRLGLVDETTQNELVVTNAGRGWIAAHSDTDLTREFRESMLGMRWSWCARPFLNLAVDAADALGGDITFRELFNWLIHSTDEWHAEELTRVAQDYRSLSISKRARVDAAIDSYLESMLTRHASDTAFGHYRGKVKDLMIAFATTGLFRAQGDKTLVLVSGSRRPAPVEV